jgi:hypothetical protein
MALQQFMMPRLPPNHTTPDTAIYGKSIPEKTLLKTSAHSEPSSDAHPLII